MFASGNDNLNDIYESVEISVIGNVDVQVDDPKLSSEKSGEENSQESGEQTVENQTVANPEVEEKDQPIVDKKEPEERENNLPSESVIMSHMAKYFAENKELTELELPENPTIDDFFEKFKEVVISKEVTNKESEIISKIRENIIEEEGLDEKTISLAMGIPYGIDRSEYLDLISINEFSDNKFDVSDNEETRLLFEIYHRLNNVKENDIKRYINVDMSTIDEDLVQERVSFIKKHSENGLRNIQKTIDERKNSYIQFRDQKVEKIRDLLQKRNIAGREYTKEQIDTYVAATNRKTEKFTLPNGIEIDVTPFEKKKYEFDSNNIEESLARSIDFYLGLDSVKQEQIKEKKENKVSGSFMNGLMSDHTKAKISDKTVVYQDDGDGEDVSISLR